MKNVPRNVQQIAEKLAREQYPANVYDAQLHAAMGDSTMFLAAVTLYAAVGDPAGDEGMDFFACAKHVMELGDEFKRAAQAIYDEKAAEAAAAAEAEWVASNRPEGEEPAEEGADDPEG